MFFVYCERKYKYDCSEKIEVLISNQLCEDVILKEVASYSHISNVFGEASQYTKGFAVINISTLDNVASVGNSVFICDGQEGKRYFDTLKETIVLLNSFDKYSVISDAEILFLESNDLAIRKLEDYFFSIAGFFFPSDFEERISLIIKLIESKICKKNEMKNGRGYKDYFPHFYSLFYSKECESTLEYKKIVPDFESNQKRYYINGCSPSVSEDMLDQRMKKILDDVSSKLNAIVSMKFLLIEQSIIVLDWENMYAIDVESLAYFIRQHRERNISDKYLIESILYSSYEDALAENFDLTQNGIPISSAKSIVPGVAVGKVIVGKEDISLLKKNNEKYILIKEELLPSDLEYIDLAEGIITKYGSSTSHPTLIAKQLGKIYLFNCENLNITDGHICIGNTSINKNDIVSIDGNTGNIYYLELKKKEKESKKHCFQYIAGVISKYLPFTVLTNTENSRDFLDARIFGSSGVGLYRSEYIGSQKLVRKYLVGALLIDNYVIRNRVLQQLENIWKSELEMFLKESDCDLFTFRTLDYPTDELFYDISDITEELSIEFAVDKKELNKGIEKTREKIGSLGMRGIRLSIIHPDIMESQIKALFDAVRSLRFEKRPVIRILLPFVTLESEVITVKKQLRRLCEYYDDISYSLGIMIETPRSLLMMDKLAKHIDFISFGTNDLTQLLWGLSRSDYSSLINQYNVIGIMDYDPFEIVDKEVLIPLMKQAIELAKTTNQNISVSVCGDQSYLSLKDLLGLGIDSVSVGYKDIPFAILKGAKLIYGE